MHRRRFRARVARLAATLCLAAAAVTPALARADRLSEDITFTADDGVDLQTTLTGEDPLEARPLIVEFSPYGRGTETVDPGPRYNLLLVQIRGTGDSDGSFDALGPRTQKDVVKVLRWACRQPWSDGRIGINGFSASAIAIYNSLHQKLPCVKAAVLKSGTFELYRDLLWPGGISNFLPGVGVLALIGAPELIQSPDRVESDPASGIGVIQGMFTSGISGGLLHPTLDSWWRERGFRGDVNHLPILMIDGFFDVESRGAFQAFQELRADGAKLIVIGAHDGAPAGTDAGAAEMAAWFKRFLAEARKGKRRVRERGEGEHNADRGKRERARGHRTRGRRKDDGDHWQGPRVQLWLADGDREDLLDGKFVRYEASGWPVPGTRWEPLALDPARSGTANSVNDGTLSRQVPAGAADQSYSTVPSLPTNGDPHNTAIVGPFGINQLAAAFPVFSEMTATEPLGLSYTTAPFAQDVLSAGPASLELRLSSTAPETQIWAVLSDVWPDGTPHPVASGRLLSSYPDIVRKRSLKDPRTGDVVQPYGDYSRKTPAAVGSERRYRVELWPIGNRFREGHRLRLHVLGASAASLLGVPAVNTLRVGGPDGSRLLFPVLPGSDLRDALP